MKCIYCHRTAKIETIIAVGTYTLLFLMKSTNISNFSLHITKKTTSMNIRCLRLRL